jgi:hypothetical protein
MPVSQHLLETGHISVAGISRQAIGRQFDATWSADPYLARAYH